MSIVLGVDIDSYAIHVCAVPTDGGVPAVVSSALRKRGDDEHKAITAVASALGRAVVDIRALRPQAVMVGGGGTMVAIQQEDIGGVWVERGYGSSRRADFILGCIYGAVIVAAGHVLPGVAVRQMAVSTWKRSVTGACGIRTQAGMLGNGNVKKEVANQCCRQMWEAAWPLAIIPSDPNQLDAFGIAYTASLQ